MATTVNAGAVSAPGANIFCDWAPRLRLAGFGVLPVNGKRPLVSGFRAWRSAPTLSAISRWAVRHANANVGYIPGLSGLVVLDADDAEACHAIPRLFGDTPGKVRTRRGTHYLYRHDGADLGQLASLKAYGLNADLKHGRSIVVAPPSAHENEPGFTYTWIDCDETVIGHLPGLDVRALQTLLDQGSKKAPNVTRTAPRPRAAALRNESRGLGLNDFLVGQAWALEDVDTALDIATTFNMQLVERGLEPLDEREVRDRTLSVLKDRDAGKIERRHQRRAAASIAADEVRLLTSAARNGDAAIALLALLRAEHGARVKRGETFAINASAMASAETLGRWSARKYRAARDLLLRTGFIRVVVVGSQGRRGRVPTQYSLVDRPRAPSLRAVAAGAT